MTGQKNLCAQIPIELHNRVSHAREESGLTTAQYITNLLTEYFEMKENGGNQVMTNSSTRTMAFQISEELFQRIKRSCRYRRNRRRSRPEMLSPASLVSIQCQLPRPVGKGRLTGCQSRQRTPTFRKRPQWIRASRPRRSPKGGKALCRSSAARPLRNGRRSSAQVLALFHSPRAART